MKNIRKTTCLNKTHFTKGFKFIQPLTNNKYGQRQEEFYTATIFNKLKNEIWKINNYKELKKYVKTWLILNDEW